MITLHFIIEFVTLRPRTFTHSLLEACIIAKVRYLLSTNYHNKEKLFAVRICNALCSGGPGNGSFQSPPLNRLTSLNAAT